MPLYDSDSRELPRLIKTLGGEAWHPKRKDIDKDMVRISDARMSGTSYGACILHVAPEQCFYSNFKSHFKKYITFDLESPLADIKGDICNLPFNDNQFDYILCNHVLEHVYDDQMAMNEIFRVLKKGGIAILQVPIDYNKENTLDGRDIDDKKLRNKKIV